MIQIQIMHAGNQEEGKKDKAEAGEVQPEQGSAPHTCQPAQTLLARDG
jgi:hypothetical protein